MIDIDHQYHYEKCDTQAIIYSSHLQVKHEQAKNELLKQYNKELHICLGFAVFGIFVFIYAYLTKK